MIQFYISSQYSGSLSCARANFCEQLWEKKSILARIRPLTLSAISDDLTLMGLGSVIVEGEDKEHMF